MVPIRSTRYHGAVRKTGSIVYGSFGDILVSITFGEFPTEEDWAEWMNYATEMPELTGLLVIPGDSKLSVEQRTGLRELHSQKAIKIAVLTQSRLARGILTALGWFNIDAAAFKPTDLDSALEYLGCSAVKEQIETAIQPYRKRLLES